MALANVSDLNLRLVRDWSGAEEGRAISALADAEALVKAITGQSIEQAVSDTVVLDGNGRRRLQLPEIPVTAVTSVTLDGTLLTVSTEYDWDAYGGLYRRNRRSWPLLPRIVSVVYTHGYTTPPRDLVALICRIAAANLDRDPGVRSVSVNDGGGTFAETYTDDTTAWPITDRAVIDRYQIPVGP